MFSGVSIAKVTVLRDDSCDSYPANHNFQLFSIFLLHLPRFVPQCLNLICAFTTCIRNCATLIKDFKLDSLNNFFF